MLYGRWDWAVSESATGTGMGMGTGAGNETETGVSSWGLASSGVIKTLAQVRAGVGRGRGKSTQSSCGSVVYFVFVMLVKQFPHAKGWARGLGGVHV